MAARTGSGTGPRARLSQRRRRNHESRRTPAVSGKLRIAGTRSQRSPALVTAGPQKLGAKSDTHLRASVPPPHPPVEEPSFSESNNISRNYTIFIGTAPAVCRCPPGSGRDPCSETVAPSAQSHDRPDGFHDPERPSALQEPISRTERTGHGKSEDEPRAALLKRVADQHGGHGEKSKRGKRIH
jgi:hypothetical protein